MLATIINGKETAGKKRLEIAAEVKSLKARGVTPGLAVILVGNDPASRTYVNNKEKDCSECGIVSEEYALPEDAKESEVLELIDRLNAAEHINGILVQLPVPKHISEEKVLRRISPRKDVDAFHPENVGKIMLGDYDFLPCTPSGVMDLLDEYGIRVEGKSCVVVGRSNIVGKPQAMLLLHRNGTVTICHSRTKNLAEVTKGADILIVAIGKADFIKADMVKDGAVVIDVGMNRRPDGKLTGDVDFAKVSEKASFITPVPGGVGPMTRLTLLKNTIKAARLQKGI
ncbi:MAG: bifunctional methylenetetrahydrofolate dehydrogenase/methenyltetrahydrofolate cyclohydrolase FolD [Bacillota bacterium]|nr:bifunctional methylenetetrahydrofolate dehydrogenase/methenyltetrahydrofolate cyclohydrolase FolD [Bacillota bacterium]